MNGQDGEAVEKEAEEDGGLPSLPRGPPMPALPPLPVYQGTREDTRPLFSPEQLKEMDTLQRSAPMIQDRRHETAGGRGSMMSEAEQNQNTGKGKGDTFAHLRGPKAQYFHMETKPPSEEERENFADEMVWRWKMQQEVKELGLRLRASQAENRELRSEMAEMKGEGKFQTPESDAREEGVPPPHLPRDPGEHEARPQGGAGGEHRRPSPEDQRLQIMTLMLKGMQDLQQKMNEKDSGGSDGGVEVVRNGIQDLPSLAEWEPTDAPLKMGDWLALLEPIMADLSTTSDMWWRTMVEEMTNWYQTHIKMPPLARASHEPVTPDVLMKKQWQRLERRVASLLLRAIPEQQREELVASKRLYVFGILCHLQLVYQPGGLAEKQTLIRNLEDPPEASSLGEAVQTLRRWMRWRQRAREVQTSEPDPTVLIRALTRITGKVLDGNKELNFRLALARSQLLVDTAPTREVVNQFTTHLLAEMEQVSHMEKKTGSRNTKTETPKVKKVEEEVKTVDRSAEKKIKEIKREDEKTSQKAPCRFYMTDQGCRKGKACTWPYVLDETLGTKKRCWTCGSTRHFSTACPTATSTATSSTSSGNTDSHGAAKVKTVKEELGTTSATPDVQPKVVGEEEQMKSLIDEANKMLKGLHRRVETPQEEPRATLENLQRQLDALKSRSPSIRVLRLTKMNAATSEQLALLDSGATHPMRSLDINDKVDQLQRVMVSLADGKKVPMLMSAGGVMISTDMKVEPIIPLGWLAEIGCRISWTKGGLEVKHPTRGILPVTILSGCPQVPRALALELIKEFETNQENYLLKTIKVEKERIKNAQVYQWLQEVVLNHPVLSSLPTAIKNQLAVEPGEWAHLPVNRHRRKRLKQGFALHLFAGEQEGYTLEKAMQERKLGQRLLEVDLKRGPEHDLLASDGRTYAALLRAAVDGTIWAVVGGPNCRSRSVLRHYPGGPRPVRAWNGEEFGLSDLNAKEQQMVTDDDVMMWRFLYIAIVADLSRKARGEEVGCAVALEQPSAPDYMPETVSWWRTSEWQHLKQLNGWHEQHFNQGDYSEIPKEVPVKPTTFGGSLHLALPTSRNTLARGRDPQGSKDSQALSRWVPGLMKAVAEALGQQVFGQAVDYQLRALSWNQHVEAGHVPFRRDCRICQEAAAKGRPHRKVQHPLCGTLSVDTTGPFKVGIDYDVKTKFRMKYMLVGAFTWLKPDGGYSDPEDVVMREGLDGLPVIEDEAAVVEPEEAGDLGDLPDLLPGGDGHPRPAAEFFAPLPPREPGGDLHGEEERPGDRGEDPGGELHGDLGEHPDGDGPREERRDPEVNVFRLCIPMETKGSSEVLQAINAMYIQLRVSGYSVVRLHTDKGGEYRGKPLQRWCDARSIHKTTTAGVSSQSNGRAERSIQEVKSRIQRLLLSANMDAEHWPQACRYVHQMERRRWSQGHEKPCPPFGAQVLIKRRFWGRQDLQPTHEVVRYMSPDPDSHGHRVMKENGMVAVAPYYIAKATKPDYDEVWVGLIAEQDQEHQALDIRRRIRGKTTMKTMRLVEEPMMDGIDIDEMVEDEDATRKDHHQRLRQVLQQEATLMVEEDLELMGMTFDGLKKIKMAMPEVEEEDLLRTKIISVQELMGEKEKWDSAIRSEMDQLFNEKKALVKLDGEAMDQLRRNHGENLVVIPMKAVLTKKPGPRRRFRLVACGNFVERTASEDVFASGADALAVRYSLKRAAEEGWSALTIDVKVAFLNAPLVDSTLEEEETIVVLRPPPLLVKLGYALPGEHYRAVKAIYGLRQSPKRWGDHRDRRMRQMRTVSGYVMRQSDAEPNLWKILWIREDEDLGLEDELTSRLYGLIIVYVDDLLILSVISIVEEILAEIKREWETSQPEWVGRGSIRFLGMEISRFEEGFFANQSNYIRDKDVGEFAKVVKSPMMKEMYPPNEDSIKEEEVRKAQKDVGELLWLATRTRPDIAFVTSRMSQQILTAPRWVHNMSEITWNYLRCTPETGLWFKKDGGVNLDGGCPSGLQAFSDISFAPGGEGSTSHGAVYITWNGGLMLWRSSRQPFPTLSTAESELVESIEAFTIGDAVDTVLKEFEEPHGKRLLIDNAAAVALLGDGPTSWRTRHLKVRAQGLRWRITSLDWRISHVPGAQQIADVGTKPLPPQRLQELQVLMNMGVPPEDPTTEVKVIEGQLKGIRNVLWAGLVMSQIHGARSSDGDQEEEELSFNWSEILFWAAIYGIITWASILVWEGLKVLRRVWMSRSRVAIDDLRTQVDDLNETSAASAQRGRGARGRAMATGLFEKPLKEVSGAGEDLQADGEAQRATAAGHRDGGHLGGALAALQGGRPHDAQREVDRGGEDQREVTFEVNIEENIEENFEETFDEENSGDTREGDPEAAFPGDGSGGSGEDHHGRDEGRPGEAHEDAEMREEETPERDEALEPSDREGSYIQPESSSPFSEAPMISSSEYGGRRVRFNAFGPGRSPPTYPYGPRNSSEEPENREQPAEMNEYDGVPILPIHEEDNESLEYEPEYDDEEGSSISGLTIPYAGLDDGPSGDAGELPPGLHGEADHLVSGGHDGLDEHGGRDGHGEHDELGGDLGGGLPGVPAGGGLPGVPAGGGLPGVPVGGGSPGAEPDGEPSSGGDDPPSDDPGDGDPSMDPRYLYVTTYGQKYHRDRDCPALRNAANVHSSLYCGECAAGLGVGRRDLYGYGAGLPLHQNIQHAAMHPVGQRPLKTYGYCGRCAVEL